MVFSTSMTKKLMDITALSLGIPVKVTEPEPYKDNNNNCNCKRCFNTNGESCCNIIVNPPSKYNCFNCRKLFSRNTSAISYEEYLIGLREQIDEREFDSLRVQLQLANKKPKRISYRLSISPYHQHIHRNYKYTDRTSLYRFLKNEERELIENNIMYEYFDMTQYVDHFWNCYVLDRHEDGTRRWTKQIIYNTSPALIIDFNYEDLLKDLKHIHGVDKKCLHSWMYKLKLWISATILDRLVDEINKVNRHLVALGFNEISVGNTGLHILENISSSSVPTLSTLLSFFEVTPYQNYVVQRIDELAKSGCLKNYSWNSGGLYNGKPWQTKLPTDAELIMHFVCTYFDCVLPLTCYSKNPKPFTCKYFSKSNELNSINSENELKIIELSKYPQHYNLIINSENLELPAGKNNLFYALLLFLRYIQQQKSATIDNISLGKCGLNILWIFT